MADESNVVQLTPPPPPTGRTRRPPRHSRNVTLALNEHQSCVWQAKAILALFHDKMDGTSFRDLTWAEWNDLCNAVDAASRLLRKVEALTDAGGLETLGKAIAEKEGL